MTLIPSSYWQTAFELIRGPMVWVAFIVFLAGTVFQTFRFLRLLKRQEVPKLVSGPGRLISHEKPDRQGLGFFVRLKLSVAGVNPLTTLLTTVFHLLLVFLPFLVLGHNLMWDMAFGVSFFSLPEPVADRLTLVVILCAGIFLFRRLFLYRVRIITTFPDLVFLFLASAPFITGYFAYHQIGTDYTVMISLHMLSGELMLMAIPFTKFIHMIYMPVVRYVAVSEYSLGKANRTW